jgi:hypothetical protein
LIRQENYDIISHTFPQKTGKCGVTTQYLVAESIAQSDNSAECISEASSRLDFHSVPNNFYSVTLIIWSSHNSKVSLISSRVNSGIDNANAGCYISSDVKHYIFCSLL